MKKIDTTIMTVLRQQNHRLDENMKQAVKTYENLKKSGVIRPNTYDIPLMTRLSSGYTDNSQKHRLVADTDVF